jgi:hypothetical protein
MLKGLDLLNSEQRTRLNATVDKLNWPNGVGPKLKQMLRRGVGVHHAGMLPFYRRAVEDLFEKKLLSVAVCTETLAAGINLPARSVVVTSLMKGPFGKEKLIDPSTAHQIFGRAGRPQYDKEGHVYVLAHEDDVRILRWKEKYDQIPEDTKDPVLLKKKKELKRKKPERNSMRQYWGEPHFEKLKAAPPAKLYSKGPLPWRLLAYLLEVSPDVDRIRGVIRKRLLDEARILAGEKVLERMLLTLHEAGYVALDPAPVKNEEGKYDPAFRAHLAKPTENLAKLLGFRSVHPLYGAFLVEQLGTANWDERIQALESVLEVPRPLLKFLRVPRELSPGPLESTRIRPALEQHGLLQVKLPPLEEGEEEEEDAWEEQPEPRFAEKLAMFFGVQRPEVEDVQVQSVWAAGEILKNFGGNFNLFIRHRDLVKQEGIVFRHLLRLILLCEEFETLTPPETTPEEWRGFLDDLSKRLTETCRTIDPTSTEEMIQRAHAADIVEGEAPKPTTAPVEKTTESEVEFGVGVFEKSN